MLVYAALNIFGFFEYDQDPGGDWFMTGGINWSALAIFLVVTLFSPGPNNLSCISMGVSYGYLKTMTYIWGIVAGFTTQALVSGVVSKTLIDLFPSFESVLRVVGAVYILWMAYRTLRSSYVNGNGKETSLGFKEGFLLQYLNVKGILFVLTIYNVYLSPVLSSFWLIGLAALMLGVRSFLANSLYALFGAGIRQWLDNPVVVKAFNIAIALLLVYSAADLLGLPAKLFS